MKKFNNDAALAVAEEAFRAGFKAGWQAANCCGGLEVNPREENQAWSDFEPSEDVKALISGKEEEDDYPTLNDTYGSHGQDRGDGHHRL